MYHIKSDKRSQRSARLICNGLHKCIQNKPFPKITISDIVRAASIGRATFYRLFQTKEDVLLYECDGICEDCLKECSQNTPTRTILERFMALCLQHGSLFKTIINNHKTHILYISLNKHLRLFERRFQISRKVNPLTVEFLMTYLTYLVICLLVCWIKDGEKDNVQQIFARAELIVNEINESVKKDALPFSNLNALSNNMNLP